MAELSLTDSSDGYNQQAPERGDNLSDEEAMNLVSVMFHSVMAGVKYFVSGI